MNKKVFTTEELADRWMDLREIQNMMGKYVYYKQLKDEIKLVDDFWSARDDISLGLNNGYYTGREAVSGYYRAVDENTKIRTEHMKNLFPKHFKDKSLEEMHGVGSIEVDALTTCVLELAEDGETAKGLWYVLGEDTNIHPEGPYSYHGYGYIAGDFIREGDDWKAWHLLDVVDLNTPVGVNWTKPFDAPEVLPEFAALGDKLKALPEPTVKTCIHEVYRVDRPTAPLVRIPEPYVSFSDTFSYGI